MISKWKIQKTCSKRRLKWHRHSIKYLQFLSEEFEMPKNLLVGIYLIETNMRPFAFRLGEYIYTTVGIILNFTFKKPLKNYTIGKFQIGISSILKYYGRDLYKHAKYIDNIYKEDFLSIIKSIHYKRNFEICASMVSGFYKRALCTASNYSLQLRHIGEEFNGRYIYGLWLEDIVIKLDNIKDF